MRFTRILMLSAVLCLITPNVVGRWSRDLRRWSRDDGSGTNHLHLLRRHRLDVHRDRILPLHGAERCGPKARPAVGLGVMITGIAGLQYALMQDVYIVDGSVPTDYRYADWITTVPLMAITFAVLPGKESFTDRRLFSLPGCPSLASSSSAHCS